MPDTRATPMNEKPRILICDDEPHILHVVGLNLRQAGFEAVFAGNGEQALDAARRTQPALGIVDYQMPGMRGDELCRRLRELPGCVRLPVIMLTALDYRLPYCGESRAAPSAVMGKPFSPRALVGQVRDLLEPLAVSEAL